ncbi:MAG: hypothetical protein HUJ63_12960 [Enterococcus sp.]|nr:hypothetical protein [Enterococcus sp.]
MAKKISDNRGTINTFRDMSNLSPQATADAIIGIAESKGIPVKVMTESFRESGLFGKEHQGVVVMHPNPPAGESYFEHWIIFNNGVINMLFGGHSTAQTAVNKREARKGTFKISDMIANAVATDKSMDLQIEDMWHQDVIELIYGEIWQKR